MVKEKRILFYFICWLITGFLLIFIGINNVKANTIDYENIGMLSDYTLFYSQDTGSNPEFRELTQYEYYNLTNVSAFLVDINTFEFKSGIVYDLEVYMPANSVKNNVNFIVTDANYNQCTTYELFIEDEHYPRFRFSCPSDTTGIDLYIYNDSENYVINNGNFSWHYTYLRKQVSSVDLGPIIDQNNQIIQGQEDIKDAIKDELNSCHQSVNLAIVDDSVNNRAITDILPAGTYTFSLLANINVGINLRLTNSTGEIIAKTNGVSGRVVLTFTLIEESKIFLNGYATHSNTGSFIDNISQIQVEKGDKFTQYEKPGEQICSNKIDETNKELGNLNDSLNDSNVDGSLGSAGSFFDNFTTTDHGGLSGIITAPLVSINQMLNTSCSPMTATFKGKELSLPCGYEFWNRLGAIQDFINIVLGGLLCYRIIIKLYKSIERIKNPEDDRLEVMDL